MVYLLINPANYIASHLRDFGPADRFWCFTLERYIGIVKGIVHNTASIDKSVILSIIEAEQINYIYRNKEVNLDTGEEVIDLRPRHDSQYLIPGQNFKVKNLKPSWRQTIIDLWANDSEPITQDIPLHCWKK